MSKQSFLSGALILALAAFISKIFGALNRVLLYPVLGAEGIGLFGMAYPAYTLILVLSTAGVNIAVSKLVAERLVSDHKKEALQVFKIAFWLLAGAGLFFSLLMIIGARFLAEDIIHEPRAFYSIIAVAPAILIVSIMSAYRGLFQGLQQMGPPAISQIVEQFMRVITMFVLAIALAPWGLEFAAAGATFGAVTGGLAGLLYLIWLYWRTLPQWITSDGGNDVVHVRSWPIIVEIARLAIPISLAAGVVGVMQFIDTAVVPYRLQVMGLPTGLATAEYGRMAGGAVPLINMPTIFTGALQISLVPMVSEAMAMKNLALVRSRAATAFRLTMTVTVPAMVGLYVLARPIPAMLLGDPEVGVSLAAISSATLFLGLQQASSGILQGLGRTDIPVKNLLFGSVWKLVVTWVLTAMPAFGIRGAAYGTVIGFLIAASLNLTAVNTLVGKIIDINAAVVKPGLAALAMGFVVKVSYKWLFGLRGINWFATTGAITVGIGSYVLFLLLMGGLKVQDFELLPRWGPSLSSFLKKLGLLKE